MFQPVVVAGAVGCDFDRALPGIVVWKTYPREVAFVGRDRPQASAVRLGGSGRLTTTGRAADRPRRTGGDSSDAR